MKTWCGGLLGMAVLVALGVAACGGDTDGGSGTGGSSSGGASSGGASSGGASSGGSSSGGASSGGSSSGGAGGGGGVCSLPQDSGPCDGAMRRWWFNAAIGKCEPFIYGGCQGNENNFQAAMACVGACAPSAANACDAIACPESSMCVYTSPTNATCATPCGDAGSCPTGQTCGCGSSCSGCKDCLQVCVES